jgi:transcriptional antiterminator NusG
LDCRTRWSPACDTQGESFEPAWNFDGGSLGGTSIVILNTDKTLYTGGIAQIPAKSVSPLPWFAIQVRTRHEVGIAEHLQALGFESFLPLYACKKRWSDRIKQVEAPLFPGYIFCRFNPQNWLPIIKAPGVIQVVGYNRVPVPIEDFEIDAIRTLGMSGLPNQPWPYPKVGDRVRIESGPLRGVEGILVEFKNSHRFIVSVSLLQRSVAVEIDSAHVTAVSVNSTERLQSVCT